MSERRRMMMAGQGGSVIGGVDLGLPSGTIWARGNIVPDGSGGYKVGNETDYGAYFSWGNIVPHFSSDGETMDDGYDWGTSNSGPYSLTPGYNCLSDITINSGYDAAHELLGSSWRMPTKSEFEELEAQTDKVWTSIDGVYGNKFMKKTDHSVYVFLPATGYWEGTSVSHFEGEGSYWTSSLDDEMNAYCFVCGNGFYSMSSYYRFMGMSIRAVQ